MLRAVGFTRRGFRQAADRHRLDLGATSPPATCTSPSWRARPAPGADAAGGKGVLFNTITVSDGISMGTPGMRYSLVSREVIADSIETVVGRGGLRRLRRHRRLRQEHARLRHGDRAAQPPGGVRLRRHHSPGSASGATSSRCSRRSAPAPPARSPTRELLEVERTAIPGPGQLRRHVHRQHHGLGDRGARACRLPGQLRAGSGRRGRSATTAAVPGEAVVQLVERGHRGRATSSRARRSRTPSPWSSRSAARPTPCCTCSPSRTTRG